MIVLYGIEFAGLTRSREDMPRDGCWPNVHGDPPGTDVVRCACGWSAGCLMGGGNEYERSVALHERSVEFHAGNCERAR